MMRMPGRLRISWQDDNTLKIETDAGQQTRLLRFAPPPGAAPSAGAVGAGGADAAGHFGGRMAAQPAAPSTRSSSAAAARCRRALGLAEGDDHQPQPAAGCGATACRTARTR